MRRNDQHANNFTVFFFSDCFFRQNDFNFALQDYSQALELDPDDENIKARISVIYNEFGVTAYQDKNFPVKLVLLFIIFPKSDLYGTYNNISIYSF